MQKLNPIFLLMPLIGWLGSFTLNAQNHLPDGYQGKPYLDEVYKSGAQIIPGKVQCALFDLGGEGIGYHDTNSINKGSGEYNYQAGHCEPGSDYVCHFREKEGVDLSYTKEFLDFNHPNPFTPERWQQYIGWTEDNESCNYTVNVKKAGTYRVDILYSNNACNFKLSVNNKPAGTYTATGKTDSWHTWIKEDNVGTITFTNSGINLLTFHYNSGSNYAFLDFTLIEK